ncbi:hypothetical protein F183_A16310 [Bryobacterales bacterium F-183]|nr:hypothetical protein F183_A16310 [Bryobacterales bacterium F-183]
MSSSPAVKDAVTRIQFALGKLGFIINDIEGIYGASTEQAVLKFKGPPRNILGPGQTRPDGVVGIQTIHRLDQELLGSSQPAPSDVEQAGSNLWRFSFSGAKPAFGLGVFKLRVESEERADFRVYTLRERFSGGTLIGGFSGTTRGNFTTPDRMQAVDFDRSEALILIDKFDAFIRGGMILAQPPASRTHALNFENFQDDRGFAGSLESGSLRMTCSMRSP